MVLDTVGHLPPTLGRLPSTRGSGLVGRPLGSHARLAPPVSISLNPRRNELTPLDPSCEVRNLTEMA